MITEEKAKRLKNDTEYMTLKEKVNDISLINKSVLFIVDMNNGFANKGALYSDRIKAIIPDVVNIAELFINSNYPIIAFTDSHTNNSTEFLNYPKHCIEGTEETELVDELKVYKDNIYTICKNSTNGFLEIATQKIIKKLIKEDYENWVIVGCCVDICVKQFAETLKAYFYKENLDLNVIIPIGAVETYDSHFHKAKMIKDASLLEMQRNNIIIANKITIFNENTIKK